jgi:iron complex outermembrane receptor protein
VDVVFSVGRVSTTVTVTAVEGRATATRLAIPNNDVPAQVSSVPQELLQQQGINTLADALKNVSGVQAFRWYGVYEQFTIRGFTDRDRDDSNAVLVDGMRFQGNRYATQTNNIQSIEVLKGPSSLLYGRGAVGGAINLVRKKPEATKAYDVMYRGGRFNTHQAAGNATGPLAGDSLLYRVGISYDHSDGWRDAGADRFNVSPSITWYIGERARLTIHETFNRDRFDGDGGVPLNIIDLPSFKPDLRFSLPQDEALIEDSQAQAMFSWSIAPNWELRNSFLVQKTSDRYFVTEGIYGDPDNNEVFREPLDFHHHRTPIQNQAELIGNWSGFGQHHLVLGYDYQRDKYRTDVTAGDDPDCTCGYWWITIAPMNISTLEETNPPLDIDTIARRTFVNENFHSFYWQDQIDILPQLKINIGGRFDDYHRDRHRIFTDDPDSRVGIQERNQTAYTYRAGVVYSPRQDQQLYFGTSSSFSPVIVIPEDGSELDPSSARNYEVGHRWQGLGGRVDTSVALYHVTRDNLTIRTSGVRFVQAGEYKAKGVDLDVNTDLGYRTHLLLSYGFSQPRFEDSDDEELTGLMPRYVPKHTANVWLRKDWAAGFNASIGLRYVGSQFVNDSNTTRLGGFTIFSGAVGYRAERLWEWSLNAENLFNKERYFLPGHFSNQAFPGQPINVSSTIRLRFN